MIRGTGGIDQVVFSQAAQTTTLDQLFRISIYGDLGQYLLICTDIGISLFDILKEQSVWQIHA